MEFEEFFAKLRDTGLKINVDINEEQAKKLISEVFPNDPKRRKDELRRWQKKALRRRSIQGKLVKYTKKIVVAATRAAKECGGAALITISVILIPSQVGAEPVMINGQPIKEGYWLGFDPPVGNLGCIDDGNENLSLLYDLRRQMSKLLHVAMFMF